MTPCVYEGNLGFAEAERATLLTENLLDHISPKAADRGILCGECLGSEYTQGRGGGGGMEKTSFGGFKVVATAEDISR